MKRILMRIVVICISLFVVAMLPIAGCKAAEAVEEEATEAVEEEATEAVEEEATEAVEEVAEIIPIKIGYAVTYGTHPSVAVIIKGAVDECLSDKWADRFDVEVIMADAGWDDPGLIVNGIEDLFAQGVDGLLTFPAAASEEASTPIKELFNKNNIPVAITDAGISDGDYVCFTLSDNYLGGEMAAEYAAQFIPEGSVVQAWNGSPGSETSTARCQGYEDKMVELGMVVLPTKGTSVSIEQGQADMEDLLVSDPGIKGVFATNHLMLVGALNALESADLVGEVMLTPFDVDKQTFEAVKDGRMTAVVIQDLINVGAIGAEALMNAIAGNPTGPKDVVIAPLLCTSENWEDFVDNPQVKIE